jgi:hypothetical protein
MNAPSDLGMQNGGLLLQQFENLDILLIELGIHNAATQRNADRPSGSQHYAQAKRNLRP